MAEQWQAVYAQAARPTDARSAGWDFVFLPAVLRGAIGPELMCQPATDDRPVSLAIENESASLYFRENLRMLSHAPGLRLQIIGRVNLQEPRIVYPLAVAQAEGDSQSDDEPRLEIPKSLASRVCLGFDELQRSHLVKARASAVVLSMHCTQAENCQPLACLRRRWLATMLSGIASQCPGNTNMLAAETAKLSSCGFATGAALLDSLSSSPSDGDPTGIDTFLATAVYLRHGSYEWTKSRATLGI